MCYKYLKQKLRQDQDGFCILNTRDYIDCKYIAMFYVASVLAQWDVGLGESSHEALSP